MSFFRTTSGSAAINLYGVELRRIELDLTLQTRSVSSCLMDEFAGLPIEPYPRPSDYGL
jgi:hypothetical protein